MPRVCMMLARCTATVLALRESTMAISLLDLPWTIKCSTSSSRVVNWGGGPAGWASDPRRWSSTNLPAATCFTASTISRSKAFFRMYPRTPASRQVRTYDASACILRIRMAVSGAVRRMWRAATAPFMLGMAKSMTTTFGSSSAASCTAWWPSSASPTTVIAGSSSSMRRKPRLTRLWSSTSRTEICGSVMGLLNSGGYGEPDQRAAGCEVLQVQEAVHQSGTLAHGDQAHAVSVRAWEDNTVIFHFEHYGFRQIAQAHRRPIGMRMLGDIVQRLLHDAIEVDGDGAVEFARLAGLLVVYLNARLFLVAGQILIHRSFESDFIQDHRMQRVREGAHLVERGLHDFLDLAQIGAQRVGVRKSTAGALQHGSDRREDLAEIVVQVARDGAECVFLHGDQLLRQLAAPRREFRHLLKQAPVILHHVEAGEQNQHQHGRHEQVDVALHTGIHGANGGRGLLLGFVVLHQQPRHGGRDGLLACLERKADQGAGLGLLVALGEREDAVERVPELAKRIAQVLALLGIAIQRRRLGFACHGVFQIRPQPAELSLPCREGIGLAAFQPVAHGQAERIQVVLNAQNKKGIGAIAVDDAALQPFQAAQLHDHVARIEGHRRKRDANARQQSDCGRSGLRHTALTKGSLPWLAGGCHRRDARARAAGIGTESCPY